MARSLTIATAVAVFSFVAVGILMTRMQPAVGPDPWRGLLAVEQNLQGRSSSLSEDIVADRHDLARDRADEILWWPPGQQNVIYLLRRSGLSIGDALKTVVLATTLVGAIAWSFYFHLVLGRRALTSALIALFVWHRAAHASAFIYHGGEAFMWALTPVAVVLYLVAWRTPGLRAGAWSFVAGSVCGLLIFFKYAALIVDVGFLAAGLLLARRTRGGWATLAAWSAGLVLASATWFVASGARWPEATPATALTEPRVFAILAWTAAGPLMALGDVYETAVLVRHVLGLATQVIDTIVPLSLGAAALFIAWWVTRRRGLPQMPISPTARNARTLAVSVAMTTSLLLAVLMLRGGVISYEGRYQQYGAFLLLPFLAETLVWSVSGGRRSWRVIPALACGGAFVVGPAVYGAGLLAHESIRWAPAVAAGIGPTGVRLDWATTMGASAFVDEVQRLLRATSTLLVTTSPEISLTFPQRRVLFVLDRADAERERIRGRPDGGVLLIAPPWTSREDVEIAKTLLVDIHQWTKIALTSAPDTHVWRGQ